jgi:hypothetical protein
VRFVIANARGAGLPGAALAHVLHALDSSLGARAERRGRVVSLPHAARALLRQLLPLAGARVPDVRGVRPGALTCDGDRLELAFDEAVLPAPVTEAACRALELAALTADADDALAEGRLAAARAGYVAALEQAPRHPEVSRLVAEIDLAHGERWESALGLLVDAGTAIHAGPWRPSSSPPSGIGRAPGRPSPRPSPGKPTDPSPRASVCGWRSSATTWRAA